MKEIIRDRTCIRWSDGKNITILNLNTVKCLWKTPIVFEDSGSRYRYWFDRTEFFIV